jgi:hypothetical protein
MHRPRILVDEQHELLSPLFMVTLTWSDICIYVIPKPYFYCVSPAGGEEGISVVGTTPNTMSDVCDYLLLRRCPKWSFIMYIHVYIFIIIVAMW